ncbi:MAG: peptidylprolyl isomerase [Eubacteriales bacterium]|nr:peptidylprolyl isomerase [Eubacteriales bacterium]
MKHKILALFLASVLAAGVMTGCGSDSARDDNAAAEGTADQASEEENAKNAEFTDGEEGTGDAGDTSTDAEDTGDVFNADEPSEDTDEASGTETAVLDTDTELSGKHHAEIMIKDYGEIDVELDADSAPITVTNFVKLVQEGFYDGLTFHRIMDGFMMQGGDPLGNGTGGSEETIKGEFSENGVDNDLSHTRGAISMARSSAPDSASSQFFIVQSDCTYLDGQYAVFGYVTEGMDIVDEICKAAQPTDDNGTIPAEEQPVIETIKIVD